MEDLEYNPLRKAFLTKFRREFEVARRMCYLIAIPHSNTLDDQLSVDRKFALAHILIPSRLLKSHFSPMQAGHNLDDIELVDGRHLVLKANKLDLERTRPVTAKILAQQVGYNESNKVFKIILIDRPLVRGEHLLKSSKSLSRTEMKVTQKEGDVVILKDHLDCGRYLEWLDPKLKHDLDRGVERLAATYLILSDYLDDAVDRLKGLTEEFMDRLTMDKLPWTQHRNVRLSVENHIVHLMHDRLWDAIRARYAAEDEMILKALGQLSQSRQSVCQLGAKKHFSNFKVSEELSCSIKRLPNLTSPISMVNELLKSIDLINEGHSQSVEMGRLMCWQEEESQSNELYRHPVVYTCSDDFIATLVYSLAQVQPKNLCSAMKYLELFGWSATEQDQAAYFTATMQVAIQYVISSRPMANTT